jgi:hypothetical protein
VLEVNGGRVDEVDNLYKSRPARPLGRAVTFVVFTAAITRGAFTELFQRGH